MSKIGTGRWQRVILATLEQHRAYFARDLLGLEPTRAEQAALQRAVVTLHDARKIGLARSWGRNAAGGRLVIYRADTLAPPPHEITRVQREPA
jgi:hypothetical protein